VAAVGRGSAIVGLVSEMPELMFQTVCHVVIPCSVCTCY
jgi:hypothetical protein